MTIEVENIEDLQKVIKCIKSRDEKIIILSGALGSGKTALVKEFVKSSGIKDEVTSPTFSIQNIYGEEIFHYDLYNKGVSEFLSLGMIEEFEKEGIHFIEWGEELEEILKTYGFEYLRINITLKAQKRFFECQN